MVLLASTVWFGVGVVSFIVQTMGSLLTSINFMVHVGFVVVTLCGACVCVAELT